MSNSRARPRSLGSPPDGCRDNAPEPFGDRPNPLRFDRRVGERKNPPLPAAAEAGRRRCVCGSGARGCGVGAAPRRQRRKGRHDLGRNGFCIRRGRCRRRGRSDGAAAVHRPRAWFLRRRRLGAGAERPPRPSPCGSEELVPQVAAGCGRFAAGLCGPPAKNDACSSCLERAPRRSSSLR
jgi:hypothetical protein